MQCWVLDPKPHPNPSAVTLSNAKWSRPNALFQVFSIMYSNGIYECRTTEEKYQMLISKMLQSRWKKKYNWLTETAAGRKHREAELICTGQVHKHSAAFCKCCNKTPLKTTLKESKFADFHMQVPQGAEKYKSRSLL